MTAIIAETLATTHSIYQTFKQAFAGGSRLQVVVFAGIILVLLALLIATAIYNRDRGYKPIRKARKLFKQAMQAAGLSQQEKRILKAISRSADLPHPAMMLLGPEPLLAAARKWMGDPARSYTARLRRRRLEQLCKRLFDAPLPK